MCVGVILTAFLSFDLQEKNFQTNLKKALAICLFFLIAFSLMPSAWHKIADFEFHLNKSQGCTEGNESCLIYYPLLHILGSVFSFNSTAFLFFLNFLVLLVTPLVLFFITKNWVTPWLYFSITQYVYLVNGGAAYPQALSIIFLLAIFATKNNFLRLVLFLVGSLAHSQAAVLIGVGWFLILVQEGFFGKMFLLSCSGIFGKTVPQVLTEKVNVGVVQPTQLITTSIQFKDVLNFFARIIPFPFFLVGLLQVWYEKNIAVVGLVILLLYQGLALSGSVSPSRFFMVIPLILLPSITRFYESLRPKWQHFFLFFTVLSFCWEFGSWFSYKLQCI